MATDPSAKVTLLAAGAGIVLIAFLTATMVRFGRIRTCRRAEAAFLGGLAGHVAEFLAAASGLGYPRGLRWVSCAPAGGVVFRRGRGGRPALAYAGVTIGFEAVEGGPMEGVAAVGLPRQATAVFAYESGRWRPAGRALMNLTPEQAARRFSGSPHSRA